MQIHNGGYGAYFSTWQQPVQDLVDAIILAVIVIVMAVPEGLPLMIALVSGLNMKKMLKSNVLVKKINGIETAGSLNILFSDKTGTITKGKLEVVEFLDGDSTGYKNYNDVPILLQALLKNGIIENSSAVATKTNDGIKIIGGNGTERALFYYLGNNIDKQDNIEVISQIPFNSINKYSATTIKFKDKPEGEGYITLIKEDPKKNALKYIYYYDKNGERKEFNKLAELTEAITERAKKSMRMLAFAISNDTIQDNKIDLKDMTLIGLVAIRDEVRPEAIQAIKEVHNAGVQVVMITGDIKDTAIAIAKDAGVLTKDSDLVLTSTELQEMSDTEVKDIIPKLRVVARALPSDKSRLVKLAQELDLVVGMTGDGVNDSPALKKADVGFAMGSGTEVAKEAGDVVILDDNFNSIDKAILFGRTIYNNIRMFIMFQLTINVAAVVVSFLAPLLNLGTPLTIIQILYINLLMDTLAALMLGGESPKEKYMKEKPKSRNENIVSGKMMSSILVGAGYITVFGLLLLMTTIFNGIIRPTEGNVEMYTVYFVAFIFASLFNGLNVRTEDFYLLKNVKKNKMFVILFVVITLITIIMTFIGGEVLRMAPLDGAEWLLVIGLSLGMVVIDLIRKVVVKLLKK